MHWRVGHVTALAGITDVTPVTTLPLPGPPTISPPRAPPPPAGERLGSVFTLFFFKRCRFVLVLLPCSCNYWICAYPPTWLTFGYLLPCTAFRTYSQSGLKRLRSNYCSQMFSTCDYRFEPLKKRYITLKEKKSFRPRASADLPRRLLAGFPTPCFRGLFRERDF